MFWFVCPPVFLSVCLLVCLLGWLVGLSVGLPVCRPDCLVSTTLTILRLFNSGGNEQVNHCPNPAGAMPECHWTLTIIISRVNGPLNKAPPSAHRLPWQSRLTSFLAVCCTCQSLSLHLVRTAEPAAKQPTGFLLNRLCVKSA